MAAALGGLAAAFSVEVLPECDSTNSRLLADPPPDDGRIPVLAADRQTAGRGRMGRAWTSPRGNLYATLLLTDPCPTEKAPELGFVAGVALAEAANATLGQREDLGLKWPNDLLCGGAKLSGMLLEATRLPSGALAAVVGIGVNCRSHPDIPNYATTDIETIRPGAGDPAALFAALSDAMARALTTRSFAPGTDVATIRLGESLTPRAAAVDPIGRWRETEREGTPVVNTETLANGTEMKGVDGLKAWLKSRELLPAQPKVGEEAGADEEEGEDPREALIRRLVEYERFKNAAAELDALPVSGRDVFARGADIEMPAILE